MEAEPDNQVITKTEPPAVALERYFDVVVPATNGQAVAPEAPAPEAIIIRTAEPIVAPPVVAAQLTWSQRLRQLDDRLITKLDRLDDKFMNSRPVVALLGLGKTNAAAAETATEQTDRQARLASLAGVAAVGGVIAASGQRMTNAAKLRATGAYLWLSNPEKRLTKSETIIGAGAIAVAAFGIGYLAAKGFGAHHGLDTSQAHQPVTHPEVTPTPHPTPLPSPKPIHTPMPVHQPHPPTPGSHGGGHGNHGGHTPKHGTETGGPVRVHQGDGYTNLVNHYAHAHHLRTSGAENYRVYLQLHQIYGRHILEGITSYHLPNHGGLGISHPGLAHWHHGAEQEINKLLKTTKKKRRIFN